MHLCDFLPKADEYSVILRKKNSTDKTLDTNMNLDDQGAVEEVREMSIVYFQIHTFIF